jgi:hypothetical protein
MGSLRAADNFLRERAGTAKPKEMFKYLRRAPGSFHQIFWRPYRRTFDSKSRLPGSDALSALAYWAVSFISSRARFRSRSFSSQSD